MHKLQLRVGPSGTGQAWSSLVRLELTGQCWWQSTRAANTQY